MLTGLFLLIFSVIEARGPHHPTATVVNHHHPQPSANKKLLQDEELLHDKQHIVEDLGDWAVDPNNPMSEEEMEFKYFKAHDFDNNTKLDGLEIYEAIKHAIETTSSESTESWSEKEVNIVEIVDQVLNENDTDNDGYISYAEYLISRKRQRES